jgi:hypothetical protein
MRHSSAQGAKYVALSLPFGLHLCFREPCSAPPYDRHGRKPADLRSFDLTSASARQPDLDGAGVRAPTRAGSGPERRIRFPAPLAESSQAASGQIRSRLLSALVGRLLRAGRLSKVDLRSGPGLSMNWYPVAGDHGGSLQL